MADNTSAGIKTSNDFLPTLLDRLPTELLDQTARGIDRYDLLTHVNFCRVSQRACALYDKFNDEFWRIQCFMNGLGFVENHDISPELVSWKYIAFKVAKHADSCDGLCCGRIQLEKNRKSMEAWLRTFPELGKVPLPLDEYFVDERNAAEHHITMFKFITFRLSYIVDGYLQSRTLSKQDRPYLECFRQGADKKVEPLFEHPIAFRSFAVFPPIRTITLLDQFDLPDVENKFGVTVADICQVIMLKAGHSLCAYDMSDMLWQGADVSRDFSVPGWSFQDHVQHQAFGSLGGWFRALKCPGFLYNGDDGEDVFFFKFEPRELPKDYAEFDADMNSMAVDELEAFRLSKSR